jgi:hypothetical protein
LETSEVTHKTLNPVQRRLSPRGRRACGESGAANLRAWRERQRAGITAEVEQFRAALLAELGTRCGARERAMVEAAAITYAALCRARVKLYKARESALPALLDRIPRLSGNLLRLLKSLGLRDTRRPRTLADAFDGKVGPNG